jgi:hypothetical protein
MVVVGSTKLRMLKHSIHEANRKGTLGVGKVNYALFAAVIDESTLSFQAHYNATKVKV